VAAGVTSALTLQLLEWVAARPRTYEEAIDAWRMSCPRLSVWEDAVIGGLVECRGSGAVSLTSRGQHALDSPAS